MSGTMKLVFGKGKIKKAWQVFRLVSPDGLNLFPPNFKFIPEDSKSRGVYVEFKRNTMSFDYAIWDRYGSDWSMIFGQELAKHFEVKKAGWDSVCYESMDEFNGRKASACIWRSRALALYEDGLMRQEANKIVMKALDVIKRGEHA